MPSTSQEINVDINTDKSSDDGKDEGSENSQNYEKVNTTAKVSVTPANVDLNEDQRLAFALRDFITAPNSTSLIESDVSNHNHRRLSYTLPYIDEPTGADGTDGTDDGQSDEDRPCMHETEDVLNNAACRLRRWRAASRKLRRPRIIKKLSSDEKRRNGEGTSDHTDLADRLRNLATAGGVSTSSGELLSLAPPPPAATAPPSPSCLVTPSLADQSIVEYFGSSPECCADGVGWESGGGSGPPAPPPGPRYKLATEGPLRVCSFQHTRTVYDKILAAKFLRRWETHVFSLQEEYLEPKMPCGLVDTPLPYNTMDEVYCISRWDPARKYCLRIVMPQGSLLLQANDAYTRDQWYHSIIWKRNMVKYRNVLKKSVRMELVMKELKNMVDFAMTTPLQDESVTRAPLQLLTRLLSEDDSGGLDWDEWAENAINSAAPLLAERCAGGELCELLARLCRRRPRGAPLPALAPPVRRVLTRNVDFARAPHAKQLVRDYISAMSAHDSGPALVRRFVQVTHGNRATCPYPRAATNLAAVALAALDDHYRATALPHVCSDLEHRALCFIDILEHMSEWEDWLTTVSGFLQPVPLSAGALACPRVSQRLANILRAIARDPRCSVHSCLSATKAVRLHPPSWLRAASPSESVLALPTQEIHQLWGDMIGGLLKCCGKRKSFLQGMSKHLPDFLIVALTGHPGALEALCYMLEWDITNGEQTQLEIIAALQASELGRMRYKELCDQQQRLQLLQAEGGPRRLALPVRATDADVAAMLEAGALGNLECLSLAFTSVTSACAHHLIKLPSLRYLNLWATQFGDSGLQLIAEHLPRLQVLNLCETPVSDKGIEALSALSSLRRLNLNSTKLSAEAFEMLRQKLPQLQEFDIRYTEAW